jgi:hypothetical protein
MRRPLVILYMTLHPVPSAFHCIWGQFSFLFYQCTLIQVIHAYLVHNNLQMSSTVDEQGHFSIYYLLSGIPCTCSWYARMHVSVPRQPDDKAKSIFSLYYQHTLVLLRDYLTLGGLSTPFQRWRNGKKLRSSHTFFRHRNRIQPPPSPICHTERRKTKREKGEREVAVITVLAAWPSEIKMGLIF